MKALLLGSISTLADTSELQREAFNAAFRQHGLPWVWERDAYRGMLRHAGGAARIAAQAEAEGRDVDADAVHATKSLIFQDDLAQGRASIREGVADAIEHARRMGMPVGLVTTTSKANVDRLLAALRMEDAFDVVVTAEQVTAPKPAPDCYHLAAATLAVAPESCTAIEDNEDGVAAAMAAGMTVMAWPNANTEGHEFGEARVVDGNLDRAVFSEPLAAE
ncbi:HAD-IA family hydrolase [Jannaschia sp. Os4]|uniref:HAD family hydrolase n=1 Tax=Jannaschia sp. Os4 TaxID=2807617 RepID=UPI001939FB4C|nr:HAD-IA family hydrolase [Jannaschia sp. Os4]MBM2577445.1 HAD-IA family hydrolase [Jannaschia sp. Os4]